jgi:excisionase family DNA binding protein
MTAIQEKQETRFLTVREAAAALRVSPAHIYRLIDRRVVPAVRVGDGAGPLRIDRDELEAWLHEQSQPSERRT